MENPPNRRRSSMHGSDGMGVAHGISTNPPSEAATSPKKRKRSRKADTCKKFECQHEGCGRSYSRAEHLYRHQLNHSPKEIYHCGFANCYRTFVRQDLCLRHQERHTTNGSQLQKRDSFPHSAAAPHDHLEDASSDQERDDEAAVESPTDTRSPTATARPKASLQSPSSVANPAMHQTYINQTIRSVDSSSTASVDPHAQPPTPQETAYPAAVATQLKQRSGSSGSNDPSFTNPQMYRYSQAAAPYTFDGQQYHSSSFGSSGSTSQSQGFRSRQVSLPGPTASASNPYMESTGPMVNDSAHRARSNSYVSRQNMPLSSMSSSEFGPVALGQNPSLTVGPTLPNGLGGIDPVMGAIDASSVPDLDTMPGYALPVFGEETLNRSPFAMTDDFTAWLFNDHPSASASASASAPMSIGYPAVSGMMASYPGSFPSQLQNQNYPSDTAFGGYPTNVFQHHQPIQQQQQDPMSVTRILDSERPQSLISEEKRSELIYVMQTRFNEASDAAVKKRKDALMDGNMDSDSHILSLRMMQVYIGSYWRHCHQHLPILHKPTFSADKTPNLLLLAILAIGAATLDKDYGQAVTDMTAELANFVAWHLRWEIFQHADFRPPAKLWVFQAMLLLEMYEKMYSTRALHERAHIHHDTTLTLMRRGSSLIGRSSFDSPPSLREERPARSGTGSNSASEAGAGEESWTHWIKAEATRRAAFGAFALDSTHATMFGHSAKMVAHEMRLPLPCDEALWSATSAAEVAQMQSSLHNNGVRPIIFLDALKKTLSGQRVRTNPFGRTIIMAGLLSVSWHMNQRDLQVSSLGVAQSTGGRDKWRSALIRAFDCWKRDFDETAVYPSPSSSNYSPAYRQQMPTEEDVFYESRTVFHPLAHMASHVDIVDCQIFAGAGRLLGRSITPRDYGTAREKMTQRWATKPSARDATYHALKFLTHVLIPDEGSGDKQRGYMEYSAREDSLVNRPWVLYYAALVVWCYGYALDGPITPSPPPELNTPTDQRQDMYTFLERVGGVRSPDDLDQIRHRNRCMGLLMVLRDAFSNSRWELLGEATNLLGRCIEKLKGVAPPVSLAAGSAVDTGGLSSAVPAAADIWK